MKDLLEGIWALLCALGSLVVIIAMAAFSLLVCSCIVLAFWLAFKMLLDLSFGIKL